MGVAETAEQTGNFFSQTDKTSLMASIPVEVGETIQFISPDNALQARITHPGGIVETWDIFIYPPDDEKPYKTTQGTAFFRWHYTTERIPEKVLRQTPRFTDALLITDWWGQQGEPQNRILEIIQSPRSSGIKPVEIIQVEEQESRLSALKQWIIKSIDAFSIEDQK